MIENGQHLLGGMVIQIISEPGDLDCAQDECHSVC